MNRDTATALLRPTAQTSALPAMPAGVAAEPCLSSRPAAAVCAAPQFTGLTQVDTRNTGVESGKVEGSIRWYHKSQFSLTRGVPV
jgi:hypothetical protein